MKLYSIILTSVIATLLLCWTLEPLRGDPAKGNRVSDQQTLSKSPTTLVAVARFVISVGGGTGWQGWGWGGLYGGYGIWGPRHYATNPYSFGQLGQGPIIRTPGYSYWRLPKNGLLMLQPNRMQHYYPFETTDHPPVPWEHR